MDAVVDDLTDVAVPGPAVAGPVVAGPVVAGPVVAVSGRDPDNSHVSAEDCPDSAQIGPQADSLRLEGRVCRFEALRWPGEAELRRIARMQHGCLHRRQLLAAGVSAKALAGRLRRGEIRRLHPDVFALDLDTPDAPRAAMAAALQLRGDGVVSGSAAAVLWGLADEMPGIVEVTLVARNARPQPGLRIRRVSALQRSDIRFRRGVPVTAPARTLIDLAATLGPLELENALAEARIRRLASDAQIQIALDGAQGRKGTAAVKWLLRRAADGQPPARTRSYYERRLLALIRQAELSAPVTNVKVEGQEVDMLWPAQRLIVEFDGYAYHHDRAAFERDRLRDQRLIAAGYRVIRITARQLDETPFAVIARLARALG